MSERSESGPIRNSPLSALISVIQDLPLLSEADTLAQVSTAKSDQSSAEQVGFEGVKDRFQPQTTWEAR